MRWLVLAAGLLASSAFAQDAMLIGAGSPSKISAGGGYTGPGDVQAGAYAWWGFRAYSAAKAAAHVNVVKVCPSTASSGSDPSCINITANTNGTITPPSGTACGGAACTLVTTLYDQSGSNNCSTAPCDMTQATTANMPTFNGGSSPISMTVAGGFSGTLLNTAASITLIQPFSASMILNWSSASTSGAEAGLEDGNTGNAIGLYSSSSIGHAFQSGSGNLSSNTTINGTPSTVQYLIASSGSYDLDGTITSGVTGANLAPSAAPLFLLGQQPAGTSTLNITEAGIWAGDQHLTFPALGTNQCNFWHTLSFPSC